MTPKKSRKGMIVVSSVIIRLLVVTSTVYLMLGCAAMSSWRESSPT